MKILLIEDNPLDARMVLYALREEQEWLKKIVLINDGEKAIRYLIEQNSCANSTNPDVVMLDLNLPLRDGTEVLQTIRRTEGLRDLPVIVLSHLPEEITEEIVRRANVEASCYVTKTDEFLRIAAILRSVTTEPKGCPSLKRRPITSGD